MTITGRTRVFALLGEPVAHSLSPLFQNAAFRAAGLDAVYVALSIDAAEVAGLMRSLATNGGGNVTIPHKAVAARVAAVTDARVGRLGAANVFGMGPEGLTVANTDVDGVLAGLDRIGAPATAWCVIGTGGSARAVVGAAVERGARIAIRSRDTDRAHAFAAWAGEIGAAMTAPEACDVVVNATPLGLRADDPSPIDFAVVPMAKWALDLTYVAGGTTGWVGRCRQRGWDADDGREVLLGQGAAAWRLWFPGVEPPREVMRAALHGRLG